MPNNPLLSGGLATYLRDLQAGPLWDGLLDVFEKPEIPVFRVKDAESVETARARWIHQSGRRDNYESIMAVLRRKME